ncbi:MAG: pyruvate dehydrogenase complex dihydrolipoamide acetyltransferase [Alphaproteobacteria bacterium]|nr:pyruvate dehydrogenase complex dihydrolipoamide acetyltransferase [Alphaproteobacteria bacterium]PPR12695.1 MAG: Dihydrolipoyllysine-residue succinyltransferase component of 2-oxoglutarate dehydrogenase complex [Alphaproteobacteria bacterium MarineAlpha12_Bin1]|tara:strand:- start:25684 stop:26955 length:1272 start_codon:yes stop_codon:yes gene_type:complete
MPITILMPALSPTMTEGSLAKWLKKEGEDVIPGDVLAEIETDKATMEIEAIDEGKLGKILVPEGSEEIPVNSPIAIIIEEGEDESSLEEIDAQELPEQTTALNTSVESKEHSTDIEIIDSTADPSNLSNEVEEENPSVGNEERIFVSPLARRLAEKQSLDLSLIKGTGPNGRIIKSDIEAFSSKDLSVKADVNEKSYEYFPADNMRKTIAKRLTESKRDVPHFYLKADCLIDKLMDVREQLNARANNEEYKISVNDMMIKACAVALMKVPNANASWDREGIKLYKTADISVAVALDNGLITPVIRDANEKGLRLISEETKLLINKARNGQLAPEEYTGGSFTISNLGMFGVKEFNAVINPPQGGIVAIGAAEQRPIVKNNVLDVATVITCTLSLDHRAIDGAVGAQFLDTLKSLIENPMEMLL